MNTITRRILIGIGLCSALTLCGSALAIATRSNEGASPFQGIGAATQAASGASVVDLSTTTELNNANKHAGDGTVGEQLISGARMLSSTVDGRHVYLVPTSRGDLCVLATDAGGACAPPLSNTAPAVFDISEPGNGAGTLAYGVAVDGVRSVSFTVGGTPETVPVVDNVFVFNGGPGTTTDDYSVPTVTFEDGTTVQLS